MIKMSLTQFLTFSLTENGASRAKFVRKAKYDTYTPGGDYWKKLRETIKKVHERNLPLETLYNLVDQVDDKKKENYKKSINRYVKFLKNKNVEWFDIGSSHWEFNEKLLVRSQPELGLYIDGQPYLLKIYYKGKTQNVRPQKVQSTLTLMEASVRNFIPPQGAVPAILNLHNNKLYVSQGLDRDLLLSLEGDATQFTYLWENI
ncbi:MULTISPECIES: hypothetical protein [Bacillus cereus group]|uniref:hypothetical protein n=1 Tax=Bacillus cereus group TaxID=86661 RepID=UPI001298916E|nr:MULTISPECIES: hypothetical protein [Bacillus cereus group]MRC06206.1 hypothetical protein [Bacillus thuringiensis]MDG1570435.1 hypothetical protein [Bacillus cereus]MDO8159662.1 hypothetical protein [Bacillus toyonensis]MEB9422714.1 hypothetical protein [Bacillus cereus]MEB9508449.1 hypothetical protein [Bacillus cereus]